MLHMYAKRRGTKRSTTVYDKGGGTLQLDSLIMYLKAKELLRFSTYVHNKGGGTLRFPTYMPKAKETRGFLCAKGR